MPRATYEAFQQHEKMLFGIAYRMVGTVADAEDILQDVLIDWYPKVQQGLEVESERAYLASMVTRRAIDHLRRAYVQRESYPGTWLPEPILAHDQEDFSERLVLRDNVSMAWMLLMERLSPLERAIYVLRSVFDFDYQTIARCVRKQVAHCRKIMERAQRRLENGVPQYEISEEQHRRVVQAFMDATSTGDIHGLLNTLMPDCVLVADGGGKASAARRPIEGAAQIAAFLVGIRKQAVGPVNAQIVLVNGDFGLIASDDKGVQFVMGMAFREGRIARIYAVRNPDKLAGVVSLLAGSSAPSVAS